MGTEAGLTVDERGRLICHCCKLPFARHQSRCLIIESQHSGHRHVNVVSVEDLLRLLGVEEGALMK